MIDAQHQFGAHRIDVEGVLVICRYQGPLSLEEIRSVHDVLASVLEKHGHCYQLLDLHTVKTLEAPARRFISQWAQTHTIDAVLGFGASSLMFVLMGLMSRAIYFMRKDTRPTVLILKNEAEARAMAAELQARRSPPPKPAH
jgi:hypothetical protein